MWARRLASLLIGMLALSSFFIYGAESLGSISGRVSTEDGQPLRATVSSVANNQIGKTTTTVANGTFTLPLDPGVSKILVYSDNSITPGFDYIPALVNVSNEDMVSVVLMPAASLSLRGDLLFVDTDNIPVSYTYQVNDEGGSLLSPSGFPLTFGSKTSTYIQIPGLPISTIIVPAEAPYRLWVGASILVGTKVTTRSISSTIQQPLEQGTTRDFNLLQSTFEFNLGLVESAISDASNRIILMEEQGFYLVREKGIIARAEANFVVAEQLFESKEYEAGYDSAKISYIDAKSTLSDLNNLSLDAASSVYIIVGFLALASLTAGLILVDSTRIQICLGIGIYAFTLLTLSKIYPGISVTPPQGLALTTAISFILIVILLVFLPRFLGSNGGNGRVSLSSVLVPVFSIAKRSLKRRKLRFSLTLISLTVLVMSFVALTSLSEGYGLIVVKSNYLSSHQGILLRSSTWTESEPTFMEFVDTEVGWLLRQEGVEVVSVKIENTPQRSAITSIANNRLYSIVGIDANAESQIISLQSVVVEGKLPSRGGVALSSSLASKTDLKLGDTVKLKDQILILEGLLDDAKLYSLTDLDGGAYIPDKWINLSPPGDPPYWERQATLASEAVIVDVSTADLIKSLGVTRIALKVKDIGQNAFTERLALQRGYKTWSISGTSVVYAALGSYLEGKGLPLFIPWAIVVLNVVVTMLNSLFERKREISILSSVGLNPSEIASIFVTEASITGFIAGGLGYLAGLAFYKLMPILGLALEVHQKVSAVWSLAAIGISISAVLVGALTALRSSIVITPSLTRKWKMDEGEGGFIKPWIIPVPIKLEAYEADDYVRYMAERLKELENDQVRVTSKVTIETHGKAQVVSFIYKSYQATVGNFYTKNSVFVEPSGEAYSVRLESSGGQEHAHWTGTLIRLITMEWSNRPR